MPKRKQRVDPSIWQRTKPRQSTFGELTAGHRGELLHRIVGALRASIDHVDSDIGEFLTNHHFYVFLMISGAAIVFKPADGVVSLREEVQETREKLRRVIGRSSNIGVQTSGYRRGDTEYVRILMYVDLPT